MSDPIDCLQAALTQLAESPVQIRSVANPRYRQLRSLLDSARERRRSGLSVLEGWHLLSSWLALGRPLQALVLPERTWARLDTAAASARRDQSPAAAGTPGTPGTAAGPEAVQALASTRWLVLDDPLFDSLDLLPSPAAVLALIETPHTVLPARFDGQDLVILDRVQDPGNVGAIIRTAAAAGIRQLLTTPGSAACWSPKVLRAGMGGHFVLELFESVSHQALLERLSLPLVGTILGQAEVLYQAELRPPLAWVFGNEGEGIDARLLAALERRISIPQVACVESLNVAAAAAVCLFEQRRQRLFG